MERKYFDGMGFEEFQTSVRTILDINFPSKPRIPRLKISRATTPQMVAGYINREVMDIIEEIERDYFDVICGTEASCFNSTDGTTVAQMVFYIEDGPYAEYASFLKDCNEEWGEPLSVDILTYREWKEATGA